MRDRAGAGPAAGPAPAEPAGTAHVQAFNTLLHDMSARLAAAAALGAFVLTDSTLFWSIVNRRVEIFISYRVVEGGVVSPIYLLHIPELLAIRARYLGLCPHYTLMLDDDDAAFR